MTSTNNRTILGLLIVLLFAAVVCTIVLAGIITAYAETVNGPNIDGSFNMAISNSFFNP